MHAVEHTHTHTHTSVPLPIKSGSALRVSQDFFTERLAVFDFVILTSNKTTGTAEGFTKVKTNRKTQTLSFWTLFNFICPKQNRTRGS